MIATLIDTRVVLTLLKQMYTDLPQLIPQAAYEQTSIRRGGVCCPGLKGNPTPQEYMVGL